MKFATLENLGYFKTKLATLFDSLYVQKVTGKGLSTNDYTAAYKTKLDDIEPRANNYTLPVATDTILGGIKIGTNITNTTGVISISKTNITDALGFTPANATVVNIEALTDTEIGTIFA